MNARPEIRQRLIEIKMKKWCLWAKYPSVSRSCPPSQARRNFWRLIEAHPETARRLGLTMTSVYDT